MPRDFPELHAGTVLEPWMLNIIYDELKRLRQMKAALPLLLNGMESSSSVPFFQFADVLGGVIATASGSIGPRVSAAYGTGLALLASDDGTALNAGTITVPVKNILNKTAATGAYLILLFAIGSYWVVAIGDCTQLS